MFSAPPSFLNFLSLLFDCLNFRCYIYTAIIIKLASLLTGNRTYKAVQKDFLKIAYDTQRIINHS